MTELKLNNIRRHLSLLRKNSWQEAGRTRAHTHTHMVRSSEVIISHVWHNYISSTMSCVQDRKSLVVWKCVSAGGRRDEVKAVRTFPIRGPNANIVNVSASPTRSSVHRAAAGHLSLPHGPSGGSSWLVRQDPSARSEVMHGDRSEERRHPDSLVLILWDKNRLRRTTCPLSRTYTSPEGGRGPVRSLQSLHTHSAVHQNKT